MSERLSGFYSVQHKKHEPWVGVVLILGLAVVVAAYFFLRAGGAGVPDGVAVGVQFHDVGGLTVDDPVLISGVRVGRVTAIELERAGRVLITLEVARRIEPRRDAQVAIRPLDFLGARFVDYQPGTGEVLDAGAVLAGTLGSEMAEAGATLRDRGARLALAVQDFLAVDLGAELGSSRDAADRMLKSLAALDVDPLLVDARTSVTAFMQAAARLDFLVRHPSLDSAASWLAEARANAADLMAGSTAALEALDRINEKLDGRTGTLGLALHDSLLRQEIRGVQTSLRRLPEAIKPRR
ncbi:MAG TPA: MlaD family protein [Gemmatimonadales bacterium]